VTERLNAQLHGIGLGAFRFVLAMFVALSHLWAGMPHGFERTPCVDFSRSVDF
jgi:hypothetical protein